VNILLESRVRENRLHGSTRGFKLIINLEIYYEVAEEIINNKTPEITFTGENPFLN